MLKIKVEEAVDKLSKTKMGIHYMIVYADFKTLRMFYSQYTKRQIEENHESVLINTFYDTSNQLRRFCMKMFISMYLNMKKKKHY